MYRNRLLGGLLMFLGVGIIGYWGLFIAQGNMTDGLRTVDGSNYLAIHQMAELIMALASITGGFFLWQGRKGSIGSGLVACGLLLYSGVNSMAWSVRNDPALTVIFVIVVVTSIYGISDLVRRIESKHGNARV